MLRVGTRDRSPACMARWYTFSRKPHPMIDYTSNAAPMICLVTSPCSSPVALVSSVAVTRRDQVFTSVHPISVQSVLNPWLNFPFPVSPRSGPVLYSDLRQKTRRWHFRVLVT
jgi:hypothetical protein